MYHVIAHDIIVSLFLIMMAGFVWTIIITVMLLL